ncbi:aa3-type cytochrome oxidase subunit III [Parenemella sanctibonifatiensis]|uniref:cytochrome-c oxidase n=1 Tax=Parenemella sanctibonifatiensis TaxID=2016505 RepID=A0A255EJL3_9ACTN|nr:cytochrome B [Parenemella sanctibonifatiensis]
MANSAELKDGQIPSGALHPIARARMYGVPGRPDMVSVGTFVWLASELMFFAALFASYFTIRNVTNQRALESGTTSLWESATAHHDIVFASINTTVLVLSSITCQAGANAAEAGRVGRTGGILNVTKWGLREWFILTFLMGAFFIGGQAYEYATLVSEGFAPQTDAYWSAFFLATGFHGIHVIGGLFAFLYVLGRTYMARTFTHEQAVSAHVVSYYWHFVDAVWIVLFAVIYLVK